MFENVDKHEEYCESLHEKYADMYRSYCESDVRLMRGSMESYHNYSKLMMNSSYGAIWNEWIGSESDRYVNQFLAVGVEG